MKLQSILDAKHKREILSVAPDTSVADAIHTLCEHRVGALVVINSDEQTMEGIVTERDLLQCMCAHCHDTAEAAKQSVREVMTTDVVVASPDDHAHKALAVMSKHHIRHLPVVDGDRVVGIISIGDLLRELYAEDELKIRHLSDFLGGTYGLKVY
ncbi:MAG: CBS domain-containing protein [Verrucomicrobiota bacterium]